MAQYLRARVALWTGDYTQCIDACEDILSHYKSFIAESNYGFKSKDFDAVQAGTKEVKAEENAFTFLALNPECILAYIIHSGFISGYQNRYGDNLKPPTNVYHRMTA